MANQTKQNYERLRETLTKSFRHDELVDAVIDARRRADAAESIISDLQLVDDLRAEVERLKRSCIELDIQRSDNQQRAEAAEQRADDAIQSLRKITYISGGDIYTSYIEDTNLREHISPQTAKQLKPQGE